MKCLCHSETAEQLLSEAGIKATPNRILIARELLDSVSPLSLIEMENRIGTMERSSVLRVLNIFLEKGVIHTIEDGRGVTKYEICRGKDNCAENDMHAHFYCEKCDRTYCFTDISAPRIPLPPDFNIRSVNYMLKGICPACKEK